MFNTIPSPCPQPDLIKDRELRKALDGLLANMVPGLKTKLYGYQTRSAAVMLEREAAPRQVLDPRLLHAHDQHGCSWYYDDVAGTVLREPRHYDAVSGGILAEEMGTGKTLICLALIVATKFFPRRGPGHTPKRRAQEARARRLASRHVRGRAHARGPFRGRCIFGTADSGAYPKCVEAVLRNPGRYFSLPRLQYGRQSRHSDDDTPADEILLSSCSLIIVPKNLMRQWQQEIAKHTTGLTGPYHHQQGRDTQQRRAPGL